MPAVLTATSSLVCAHGFAVVLPAGARKLTVDGQSVLAGADLIGAQIPCTDPKPCGAIATIGAGLAGTLRVGGEPVALDTANGTTAFATWRVVSAGQTKLEAA